MTECQNLFVNDRLCTYRKRISSLAIFIEVVQEAAEREATVRVGIDTHDDGKLQLRLCIDLDRVQDQFISIALKSD